MENKLLRIMGLPVDRGGCGFMRIRQPFEMIQKHTYADTHVIDKNTDDMIEVSKALELTHILVGRPGSEIGIKKIIEMPQYKGKVWAIDIDDNVQLINPYSNHYEEYGVEEVKHGNKWLWKDGVANFDLEKNKRRLEEHLWGLKNCNLITVTTPKLAEYAKYFNDSVAVLPNCIDFAKWWPLDFKPNKQLRVGWAGGSSHYEDLYTIKKPLNQLMRKYKFKFVFIGHGFPGIIDSDNKHLIESEPWVPFEAHSFRLMALNLDIAVVPIKDMEFNYYKSALKWYEMSAMQVPSVVADFLPYSEEIKNGKTAMAYKNEKEFYNALKSLLENPKRRTEIANNAYRWVKANRDAKKMAQKWVDAYKSVLN